MKSVILFGLMAFLLLAGCTAEEMEPETPDVAPPPPAPVPVVTIMSPAAGEVIYVYGDAGDVPFSVSIQNLLLQAPGGPAAPGQGHFRLTVDGGEPQTMTTVNYILSGLAVGEHTVELELLNNDRTPYTPTIRRQVTFRVERETPAEYVPQEHTVNVQDFSYSPASLTVKKGDLVVFVNMGAYPRSATCFIEGKQVFDTGVLGPGQSKGVVMDRVMECQYYATTHRAMTGMISVENPG